MQFVESNSLMTLRCIEKVWKEAGDTEPGQGLYDRML